MMRLDGKVALITGTGGGQGRAAALAFTEAGARVVGCDMKVEGNRETVEMVKAAGGEMVGMEPVDLGDPAQAQAWIEEGAARFGRVDILYNNASAARFAPIADYSVEDWRFAIRNELDLVFYASKFAWPHLKASGGVIINTASVAGLNAFGGGASGHAAAKGGVIGLTRSLAADGAPHGIRALAISPGPIETPGTMTTVPEDARDFIAGRTLMKRWGKPEEIARLAVFLAGDGASFMTGGNVVVDGGMLAV